MSRDSPWSQRAFAEALLLRSAVTLLSDANGEAARGFGVAADAHGIEDVALRSAFLVRHGTVAGAWPLDSTLPDVEAILAAARAT